MSPIVELMIANPPLFGPIYEGVPGLRTTLEDIHYFSEGENSHYVVFWWVTGCDFETFERVAEAYERTCEVQELTALEDRRLYRLTTEPLPEERMLFPFFRRHDITMLDGRTTKEGFRLRLRLSDRDSLRTLVDKLESHGARPRVEHIYTADERAAGEPTLTERQCEALRLALERGYFESPSEVTLEELASELDITPQTLSKHVRAAVRKVVEDTVDATETHVGGSPTCTD